MQLPKSSTNSPQAFSLFNEIGIIYQLAKTIIEKKLDGLLIAHFSILNHLARRGDQFPSSLSSAFQIPRPHMTQHLQLLEKRGLIKITPSKKDGRSKIVSITKKGLDFRDKSILAFLPEVEFLEDFFTKKSTQKLITNLKELRILLDENRSIK